MEGGGGDTSLIHMWPHLASQLYFAALVTLCGAVSFMREDLVHLVSLEELFKKVFDAYELLTDESKRKDYDAKLRLQ